MSSESKAKSGASAKFRWSMFANLAFTLILIAGSVSYVGDAMFDTAMSWLMTNVNPDPVLVSAVQVAITLPMFILTIPAGVLSDIVEPRKLLLFVESFVTIVSIVFAAMFSLGWDAPSALLATTAILGATSALSAPAWLLTTPMIVPAEDLDTAFAINNASYNVSRAVGPALGGLLIATFGIKIPFWCYCLGNLGIVATLLWWRPPLRVEKSLPAERMISALRSGIRYVRNSRDMRSTLIRAIAFFPFACSYTALLPLIARAQMHDGPAVYGGLMAVIGLGSIAGTFALNSLKYRLGPDRLAALGTIGTFLALVLFGMAHELVIAIVASFVAGFSWIVMMITTFMSAQVALPEWVRGRGLAIFLTVYFGAVTLGSAVWGKVASLGGLSTALYISAAGTILGIALTWRWKLQTAAALDLTPSLHWRKPTFVYQVKNDLGPVLVTIEYDFDPKDRAAFLGLLREIGRARKRDGAYAWKIFDDPNMVGRLVETCLIQSLLEFEYIHARVTNADRLLEEKARKFLKAPPRVAFLVAASEL